MSLLAKHVQHTDTALVWLDKDPMDDRSLYIGSSDAATIAGLNKYKTAYRLYYEKKGEIKPEDISERPSVVWGQILEGVIADVWSFETGIDLIRWQFVFEHPEYPWMRARPDRLVKGTRSVLQASGEPRGLVEIKTTNQFLSHEWAIQGQDGTDTVPWQYAIQIHHQLLVTGYDYAYCVVLIGGSDMRYYRIERDETIAAYLVQIERDFWRRLQENDPPPLTHAESAYQDARARYASLRMNGEAKVVDLPEELWEADAMIYAIDEELSESRARAKVLESERDLKGKAPILAWAAEAGAGLIRRPDGETAWSISTTKNGTLTMRTKKL